jgi:type III secretion protein J
LRAFIRLVNWLSVAGSLLVVQACSVPVSSNLSEKDATEIVVVLSAFGIDGSKSSSDGKTWAVNVPRNEQTAAAQTLLGNGLPRTELPGVADLMKKDSLVSSPSTERTKVFYLLGNELAKSLSDIDGVVSARVHVVVPERDPFRDKPRASSASVLVKHTLLVKPNDLEVPIKNFVSRGIEGLSAENVSVTFIAARAPWANVPRAASDNMYSMVIAAVAIGFLALVALGVYLRQRNVAATKVVGNGTAA